MNSKPALCLALAAVLLCLGAAKPDPREAKLKESMQLAPGTKMRYLDEAGHAISFDAFFANVMKGGAFNIEHDATTATVRLGAKAPAAVAPKGAPHIAPRLPRAGEAFPAFDLRSTGGRRVTSASLRGKPVLVNFFFADCTPCIAEIPVMNAYARQHPAARLYAATFDEAPAAREFVAKRKLQWPVLSDAQPLINAVGVTSYPTFALVGADGRVLGIAHSSVIGGKDDKLDLAELSAWVDRLSRN